MAVTDRGSTKTGSSAEKKTSAPAPKAEAPAFKYGYADGGWVPELTKFSHAFPAAILTTAAIAAFTLKLVAWVDPDSALRAYAPHVEYYHPRMGGFILFYYFFLLFSRWAESDSHVLYEQLWACNVSMLFSSIGMFFNMPLLTGLSCALVAVDQLCWYIDIIGWLLTGLRKFPIGVAGYLVWPTTSLMKRVTAAHHLWFLPAMLYTLQWRLPEHSFLMACAVGSALCWVSRFTTPFHCLLPLQPGQTEHRVLYLNINASYAFWKDVKAGFLHICDHTSPFVYLPYLMVLGNVILNLPANLVLAALLRVVENWGA